MPFSVEHDAPRLRDLARRGIYLGTSSWKYEGWIGQVYRRSYAGARSAVNRTRFAAECLREYAEVFPTVCFDGGYWRLPVARELERYAGQLPEDYPFAIKVTSAITERRSREGEDNPGYLDAEVFREQFLAPVRAALGTKLGPMILEFSPYFFGKPFGQRDYEPIAFIRDLHAFLEKVPKDGTMLAVEVRDPEILVHPKYAACLAHHAVAHVFNEQTWMPEIAEQLEVPGIAAAPFAVIRALVRPGMKHNDAVKRFEPYDRTQLELPVMREGIAEAVRRALAANRRLYAYVNNRTEGNAPNTLAAVLEAIEGGDEKTEMTKTVERT